MCGGGGVKLTPSLAASVPSEIGKAFLPSSVSPPPAAKGLVPREMRNQIQRKADTCPGRGRGRDVQHPDAALPGGWILPSVGAPSSPSRAVGEEDSRRPGGSRGVGVVKGAAGWARTRLASGPCAPKAPGEPGAQRWGLGGAAEGGGPALRPAPSLLVEQPRAPAAESARFQASTFSFFPSGAKLRDS